MKSPIQFNRYLLSAIVCVLLNYGCNSSNNSAKQEVEKLVINNDIEISRSKDSINKNDTSHDFFNSNEYSFDLGEKSVFGEVLEGVKIDSTIIDVTTYAEDQSVTNSPLNSDEGYYLNNILKEFYKYEIDTLNVDTTNVFKLIYKNSIISLIEGEEGAEGLIPYAIIKDKEIPLNFGLRIGMSDKEVLNKLFGTDNVKGLKELEKILVGTLVGNFYTYFNFENNKLISIQSGFDSYYLIEELGLDKTEFKFDHLKRINFPNNIGNIGLKYLDTVLSKKYFRNYNPPGQVYLYSNQNDINDLKVFTVFNEYELCQKVITLVITDKDKNIISLKKVAEGGGCDLPSESYTEFINDSIFRRVDYPDLSYEHLDSLDQIGHKYSRITDIFRIKPNGTIENLDHKVDTLTVK